MDALESHVNSREPKCSSNSMSAPILTQLPYFYSYLIFSYFLSFLFFCSFFPPHFSYSLPITLSSLTITIIFMLILIFLFHLIFSLIFLFHLKSSHFFSLPLKANLLLRINGPFSLTRKKPFNQHPSQVYYLEAVAVSSF